MPFVDLQSALAAPGLRLVVAANVPSPWSEAALAIFRVKKVPFTATRARALDPAFQAWNGARNLPAVLLDDQPVRTGWAEILDLAEQLAPAAPLVPADPQKRVHMVGLCHELMGEGALLWSTRLLTVDAGIETEGREGFPLRVAQYLAPRYGWTKESAPEARIRARARALEALSLLDGELARSEGPFYEGTTMTALDLYSAAALNALVPLPDADCPLAPPLRAAFAFMGTTMGDAITPALRAHRDHVVKEAFELPIML